jgi:site-specific recombinase XerD
MIASWSVIRSVLENVVTIEIVHQLQEAKHKHNNIPCVCKYRKILRAKDGGQYSATSVQSVFRKAVKDTNANPWSTPHTLRHSFATHLMQSGVSMRVILNALGHSSSKSTEIYNHVTNNHIKDTPSPLDFL